MAKASSITFAGRSLRGTETPRLNSGMLVSYMLMVRLMRPDSNSLSYVN